MLKLSGIAALPSFGCNKEEPKPTKEDNSVFFFEHNAFRTYNPVKTVKRNETTLWANGLSYSDYGQNSFYFMNNALIPKEQFENYRKADWDDAEVAKNAARKGYHLALSQWDMSPLEGFDCIDFLFCGMSSKCPFSKFMQEKFLTEEDCESESSKDKVDIQYKNKIYTTQLWYRASYHSKVKLFRFGIKSVRNA